MSSRSVIRYSEKGNDTLTEKSVLKDLTEAWFDNPDAMEPLLQKSKTYRSKRFKVTLTVEEVDQNTP